MGGKKRRQEDEAVPVAAYEPHRKTLGQSDKKVAKYRKKNRVTISEAEEKRFNPIKSFRRSTLSPEM